MGDWREEIVLVKSVDLLGEFTPRTPGFATTLSSTQCSLVDATAAFIGGTYVSPLRFNLHEATLNYHSRTYMGYLSVGECSRFLQRYAQPQAVCDLLIAVPPRPGSSGTPFLTCLLPPPCFIM
jgi:hypothetical protein